MTNTVYRYRALTYSETDYVEREFEVTGPLYHGGRARVGVGALITTGRTTNSWGDEPGRSTHVYFTTRLDCAAAYARKLGARGHVYEVEPTGAFKVDYTGDDYKTQHALRVLREVPRSAWDRIQPV